MSSWTELATSAPALAETVRRTFAVRKHATMATITRHGAPRISGNEVQFGDDGHVYLAMMPGTRRADDLRRDPRLAIHSPTEDTPQDRPETWLGDGKITGRAVEIEPNRFRVDIDTVVLTRIRDGLEISTWRADTRRVTVAHR
ncbi:MAG TPA: pyridoxamine 5'-phosphate oxidase family protein [Jatrophihabitans sp.]|jgi:hypothetical protein|nr:pyridoxamine 5'-phosphate oxidase family protein [Jatrophihabitans sp.]